MKNTTSRLKSILYWIIMAAILGTYIAYNMLGWSSTLADISKYLDGILKSIMLLALASGLGKLASFVIVHLGAKTQKGQTVTKLLASIIKYAIAIVIIIIILNFFIEDTSSLITGISMLTLVIGLGAQSLISDIVAGIFIVFEGDYQVGDVVVIDGWRGKVNEIGIRTTKIEDAGGNIQIINNSKISKIINNSSDLSLAICEVGIEYGESIPRVENILKDYLPNLKTKYKSIVEGPFYVGVSELGDSAVVLKFIAKCQEDDKYQLQRDMNREIKLLFDENNIGIPFPQVTVSKFVENGNDATLAQKKAANEFIKKQSELSHGIEEQNNN